MPKVKITVTESRCRGGYHKEGDEFMVEDICPPLCHELWSSFYPGVYALLNGAELDYGTTKARMLEARCPDGGRVTVRCEAIDE